MSLGSVLKNFPRYIAGWFLGLFIAVINDYAITGFALAGVFAGLTYGVFAGFMVFFLLYSIFRIVSNHAEAIHVSGTNIGTSVRVAAARVTPAPQLEDADAEAN